MLIVKRKGMKSYFVYFWESENPGVGHAVPLALWRSRRRGGGLASRARVEVATGEPLDNKPMRKFLDTCAPPVLKYLKDNYSHPLP